MIRLVFMRDVSLAFRRAGGALAALSFCLMVFTVFSFSLGPDALHDAAPAVLLVAVLFSCMLALPGLFERDAADGSLEQYLLAPSSLEWMMAAKLFAFWLTAALPLILLAPLMTLMAGVDTGLVGKLTISLLLASPLLTCIGAVGAALTVGLKRGAFTQSLILLPLYIPVLVFAANAHVREGAALLLAGGALATIPITCVLCGVILRLQD